MRQLYGVGVGVGVGVLLVCATISSATRDDIVDCNQLDDVGAARCIMDVSSWGSLASRSREAGIAGAPFAGVKSFAAGGAGEPYFYLTPLDLSVRDIIESDNRTTLVVSLAQTAYCATRHYDPMNPFCARLMLTGTLQQVERNSSSGEYELAWNTLLDKHPEFSTYPQDHGWFLAKLNVEHIFMINGHGAAKRVSVPAYSERRTRPVRAAGVPDRGRRAPPALARLLTPTASF